MTRWHVSSTHLAVGPEHESGAAAKSARTIETVETKPFFRDAFKGVAAGLDLLFELGNRHLKKSPKKLPGGKGARLKPSQRKKCRFWSQSVVRLRVAPFADLMEFAAFIDATENGGDLVAAGAVRHRDIDARRVRREASLASREHFFNCRVMNSLIGHKFFKIRRLFRS